MGNISLLFGLIIGVLLPLFTAQKNITAESGQKNVTLTCRAPNNRHPHMTVEWSRLDLGDQYVLLYRDGHFNSYNQHPFFKNRVDLQDRQMKAGDVSLILKNVTINDAGTYECRAKPETNRRKRANLSGDPISSIYLHVDPPGQTGGHTEDGGKEAGGKEAGGKEAGGKEAGGKEAGGKEAGGKEAGGKEAGGKEAGGKKDGGKKDGGEKSGSVGLKVGLSVPAVVLVAAAVLFLIY
ncbi:butyrophilin-like protein 8 [Maylandia zebra]|uniref:butyrophilin-like protein 8 n=1 Tax=Maylandia zebra TaxID=106582 RepID=UPI00403CE163